MYHREILTVTHYRDIHEDVRGFPSGSGVRNLPVTQDTQVSVSGFGRFPWRRAWQPPPVSLPGKFQGQRSLAGYGPWGHRESDMTSTHTLKSVKFSSVAQLCLTLRDRMNCSTPGLPVHHQFPEFIQTHVH